MCWNGRITSAAQDDAKMRRLCRQGTERYWQVLLNAEHHEVVAIYDRWGQSASVKPICAKRHLRQDIPRPRRRRSAPRAPISNSITGGGSDRKFARTAPGPAGEGFLLINRNI